MFQFACQFSASLAILSLLIPSFQPLLAASSTTSSTATTTTSTPATTDITNQTDSTTTTLIAPTTDTTDPAVVDPTATIDPAATTKSDQAILDKIKKAKNKDQGTVSTLAATATATGSNSTTNKTIQDKLKLQADTATGALTFSYPLVTPPGRSGLQPDLNLSYTSQAVDNGNILGYGWSLNIPSIERLNKQGIDKLYTTNSFVSALSGEILPVTLTDTTHGTYGSRIDNGEFLKYQFNTDNSWTVTTKTGLVYQFGSTTLTRQDDPVDATRIYKWLLTEIRDQNGNYVKYDYTKDNGQIYPSQISYTHNFNTTTNVTNLGIFSVNFIKELRTDTNYSFSTGFAVKTNYRLSEIQIKTNNVLTKKYQLTYTTGDNGVRSLLSSVIETGYDESGVGITLPATKFNYQTKTPNWTLNSNYVIPENFVSNYQDTGVRLADANGDGLVDFLKPRCATCGTTEYGKAQAYLNKIIGWTNWDQTTNWKLPVDIITTISGIQYDNGVRLVDVNGDGLTDILYANSSQLVPDINDPNRNVWPNYVFLNNGTTGWNYTASNVIPEYFVSKDNGIRDNNIQLVDVNGDGLVDLVKFAYQNGAITPAKVYLNQSQGNNISWQLSSSWTLPTDLPYLFEQYPSIQMLDVNGDGLVDIVYSKRSNKNNVYLNNGKNGWQLTPGFTMPVYLVDETYADLGARFADVNGDGMIDLVQQGYSNWNGTQYYPPSIYLNRGDNTGWQLNTSWTLPQYTNNIATLQVGFTNALGGNGGDIDRGVRFEDANGDGLIDILAAGYYTGTFINSGKKPDSLISVTYPTTGSTTITYNPSAQYQSTANVSTTNPAGLLNPKLPFILQTVNQITTNDNSNINPNQTTTYQYQDGQYYFDPTNLTNRKFSGFGQITQTDAQNNQTKTFYHQGNSSNSTQGEYLDNEAKIGKVYRTEIYDNQNKLYQKSINKWDSAQLNPAETDKAKQRSFVKLSQAVEQDYDGQATHKDKALEYQYDNTTGNQSKVISYGEVTANDDGTFVDVGTDKLTTDTTYASNTAKYIIGLPAQETTTDQTSTKIKETKYYYDNLALNSVNLGNLTKQENWLAGATYLTSQSSYDSYGNVLTQTDPKGNITTYTYDSYNLYPKTITNALNQATNFSYNYNLGRVNQTTDPNNAITKTTYDGLGRVVKEEQSDINPVTNPTNNPAILVIKTTYTYNDTTFPNSIKKTDYLDTTNSVDNYTYLDGLSRPIQTKTEAENSTTNTTSTPDRFSTKDFIYNNLGLLDKESLPYSSTGISYLPPLAGGVGGVLLHPNLFTTYTYDPLQRVITATNSTGTTTNNYTTWRVSTTDQNNNQKTFTKDAYDNLIKTEEYYASTSQNSANSTTVYTTNYQYNSLNNLIKITDASGNVRNFVYDNLGRQTRAEDLHNSADTTFGVINYTYDNNSNLTSKIDANNQTTNYTYDNLNRKLTEDNTNQAGVEVNNVYDNCLNGVGRLCSATTTKLGSTDTTTDTYQYNILGLVKTDNQTITDSSGTKNNITTYIYDRQGNQTNITHPDNSVVNPTYNTAGQLETTVQANNITGFPADTNLKGYWAFNEGSGTTANDNSGNNNNGMLTNMLASDWVDGISSKALDFDGIDDYVDTGSKTIIPNGDWSISLWVKKEGVSGGPGVSNPYKGILAQGYNILYQYDDGNLGFYYGQQGNHSFSIGTISLTSNVWTHLAITKSSAGFNFYINGVAYDFVADTSSTADNTTRNFNIGRYSEGGTYFNGKIDEVMMFNKTLTPSEIQAIYSNPAGNKTTIAVTQTDYNPLGQITVQKYGNGTQTVYTYDENKLYRLTNKTTTNIATGTKLQDLTYTYDNVGNITQIIDASPTILAKTTTYQYDSLYRLTQTTTTNSANGQNYTQTYTYDPIGNITYKSDQGAYQYNGNQGTSYANPNAVTSVGGKTYTYDNNGNLINDGTWTHTWDYNNRLVKSTNGTKTINYAYDSTGNRVSKSDGTNTTYYINQYYEIENGNVKKNIFAGNEKVATIEGANTYYHHTDHLTGSNVDTDQSGSVVESTDYYPFGQVRVDSKSGSYSNDYKFTGKELDVDTDLYYYGARYYDGKIGRFVSADSWDGDLFNPQSFNKYSYALNNPLRYNDPTGATAVEAMQGYGVGLGQGAWGTMSYISGFFWNPVDNIKDVANGAVATGKTVGQAVQHPIETAKNIGTAAQAGLDDLSKKSDYEVGRSFGHVFEKVMEAAAMGKVAGEIKNPVLKNDWADVSGKLRSATKGKGNFGIGTATSEQADVMGKAWVGSDSKTSSNGKALISNDGSKQYRPPTYKPNLGKVQANFEQKVSGQKTQGWQSNAHLDIKH